MGTHEQEPKRWKPEPGKYSDAWSRIFADIVTSRRFYYSQLFGHREGQRYKPNPAERNYFLTWGKLPEHVIADDCQVCDQHQARLVMEKVKAWNQLYFDTIREDAKEAIEARKRSQATRRAKTEATAEYKASKDARERLRQFAEEMVTKMRAEMGNQDRSKQTAGKAPDIRGHGKTQGHQKHQATD